MKLYICWGLFKEPWGHHCRNAHDALEEAGYHPEIEKVFSYGALGGLTAGRRKVKKLSGNYWVPTLVLDDGSVVDGTRNIIAWAREHRAPAAA